MAEVLFVRIVPSTPSPALAFTSVLEAITVDVFDLKPGNSKEGTLIGSATGVLSTTTTQYEASERDGIRVVTNAIVQHYEYKGDLLTGIEVSVPLAMTSVATAIVLLNRPSEHREYPTDNAYDIRLRVQKDKAIDIPTATEYNIAQIPTLNVAGPGTASLSERVTSVFRQPAAANVAIPAYGSVNIPSDDVGHVSADLEKPPPFTSMFVAINKVLQKTENVTLDTRSLPLTAAESQHIASELVWNRVLRPPPDEPSDQTLALWYTTKGIASVDEDQKRQKYENEVRAYQETLKTDSLRLTNFVFSTSASLEGERKTWAATRAALSFPIKPSIQTETSFSSDMVILRWSGGGTDASRFPVPAAFFYAVAAGFTPGVSSDLRYDAALATDETRLVAAMQAAIDDGVISEFEQFSILKKDSSLNIFQACRRIFALGQVRSQPGFPDAPLPSPTTILSYEAVVTDWLAFHETSSVLDSVFWRGEAGVISREPQGYLGLVLWLVTKGSVALIEAIVNDKRQGLGVKSVDALSRVTDSEWTQLFGVESMDSKDPLLNQPFPNLLPPFTEPGDNKQRVQSWILHLQKVLSVTSAPVQANPPQPVPIADYNLPPGDLLTRFISTYSRDESFKFTDALDHRRVASALALMFPNPRMEKERAFLSRMIYILSDLVRMTDIQQPDLQFSLMEALYAQGVTSMENVADNTTEALEKALRGTLAFTFAAQIRCRARTVLGRTDDRHATLPGEQFASINPDGHLVNCIPPEHLSPLGEIQYLHDLLLLRPGNTAISTLMQNTRGNVDLLSASPANQEISLPLIDLVNESLEAVVSHPHILIGQLYDTSSNPSLSQASRLEVLPENSSPALQVNTLAYDKLRKSFDAPGLPYSQSLDVNRTFLCHLGTSRFQVLRTFRKDTTDLPQVVTATTKPDDFESHRWRLPCTFDAALEYLCISQEEYETLYSGNIIDEAQIRTMYGFPLAPTERFFVHARSVRSFATTVDCTPSDTPAPDWDPNSHWYDVGKLVRYEGRLYEVRQAHPSQVGWQPGTRPDGTAHVPGIWHTPTPCGITEWHVQTHYRIGSVVTFEGLHYVCRLEHSSDAPNWTPPNFSPAWVRGGEPQDPDDNPDPEDPDTEDPDTDDPDPEDPDPVCPDPERPDPERPEPEKPEPEKPDPEHPDPEKPDPEKPDPEKPDPEKPDPEHPDPEKPDPEKPDPEKPEPEKPDPEKPDPEKPDPDGSDEDDWVGIISDLDEFLRRIGLSYCQFLELVQSQFIEGLGTPEGGYPDCEPCCTSKLRLVLPKKNAVDVLRKIIIFVRLWRSLKCNHPMSFVALAKICTTLQFFSDSAGQVNNDFIRQLASFFMIIELFDIPFETLISLYSSNPPSQMVSAKAAEVIIERLENVVVRERRCRRRAQYTKVLASNFEAIASLSGFFGLSGEWNQLPSHTIRFLEILCHIYESDFNVGDLTFLFTTQDHLAGEDPFPLQDKNEAVQDPLQIPEDSHFNLWTLRRKLRDVDADDDECEGWDWPRVQSALDRLGYRKGSDIQTLAEHFFPSALESCGYKVSSERRQFATSLAATDAAVWNQPHAPFRLFGNQLFANLPIKDGKLLHWLREVRPLRPEEQHAVRQLYFAPRAMLAPFAAIFEDFNHAVSHLVSAETDEHRWAFFRRQFAKFFKRCEIIAEHLAQHVVRESCHKDASCGDVALAWEVLTRLIADENYPTDPMSAWEPTQSRPNSPPTQFFWETKLAGGAFAAILGLLGSGLIQEFYVDRGVRQLVWREMSSQIDAFGHPLRNEWNCPVPAVLPGLQPPSELQSNRFITIRNGLAIRDMDDLLVGGLEAFEVHWSGFLLIECPGNHSFRACRPACDKDCNCAQCSSRWTVVLQRGQKEWEALNHSAKSCDGSCHKPSDKRWLQKGAYEIEITYWQEQPKFSRRTDTEAHVKPVHTGFRLQYCGPNNDEFETIPHDMLFVNQKTSHLAKDVSVDASSEAYDFLRDRYYSTFRDIRRTYQRAFKALLLSRKFDLSPISERSCHDMSEIQYFLDNAALFAGRSYFRPETNAKYLTHIANFDFNLLPVNDPYASPPVELDTRARPTLQRQAALFDWFERLFQYASLRRELKPLCLRKPLWRLFYEAKSQNPTPPNQLVLHLGIDVSTAPATLTFLPSDIPGAQQPFTLASSDLTDERWVYRVWKSGQWLRRVQAAFYSRKIEDATPALWAANSGTLSDPSQLAVGNLTLQKFVYDGLMPSPEKPVVPDGVRDHTALSNSWRERARTALVAYLCTGNKVSLSRIGGSYATNSSDLSSLLLIDVDCDLKESITRIADAIQAVQTLVQRTLLDLEPGIIPSPKFVHSWRTVYDTFCGWQSWKKRALYYENWIQYDEAIAARKSESFLLLEEQLRRGTHSVAVPTASKRWTAEMELPDTGVFQAKVEAELSTLQDISSLPNDGVGVMAVPQNHGRPNMVTQSVALPPIPKLDLDLEPEKPVVDLARERGSNDSGDRPSPPQAASADSPAMTPETENGPTDLESSTSIPLWIKSAIRMGTKFVRVAAAGPPVALTYPADWCLSDFVGEECCTPARETITMDEYWFWMAEGDYFKDNRASQKADIGSKDRLDPTSDWDDPNRLPALLHWKQEPLTYLYWTRVRLGKFDPPRMSDDAVPLRSTSTTPPTLQFTKRVGDSLFFIINEAEDLPGFAATDAQPGKVQVGFRYIMPEDRSIVIPNIGTNLQSGAYPGSLGAFPYFIFFAPGAELFQSSQYSVALTVATALRARCCFESALKWCQLASNPLISDNKWEYCQQLGLQAERTVTSAPITTAFKEPCCSQVARDTKVARKRAATLLYLEILLDWATSNTAKGNDESLRQAQVILESAGRLLGSNPETVLSAAGRNGVGPFARIRDFVPSPAPLNPRLLEIYDRVKDKRTYLRQLISSSRRSLPTCSLCVSPTARGIACWDCSCVESIASYRFTYLLSKALEMAGTLRNLASSLLSAYEKGDTEYLLALRTTHEKQVQTFTLEIRQNQWRESDWQLQALDKQMEIAQTKLRYYRDLISHGLIGTERGYEVATQASMAFRGSSTASDTIAESVGAIPDMWFGIAGTAGTPLQFQQMPVGVKMAHGFSTAARILNTFGDQYTTQGGLNLTRAGWERREQEWRHVVDTTSIEIEQIKRQILAAKRRTAISLKELNVHRRQMEQSDEVHDFLRDKFTKQDLYLFLQNQTAQLYHQAYNLTALYVKDALRAFLRERGDYISPLSVQQTSAVESLTMALQGGAWSSPREGLMAGENLDLGLRLLERGYLSSNVREYELTKHISLRSILPLQYLFLKMTGKCTITIPEWLFDLEYPGHYMRRIKTISLTVPCVSGPYSGVRSHLKLVSSTTRISPELVEATKTCCADNDSCSCGSGYTTRDSDDPRFLRCYYHNGRPDVHTNSMIATSTGISDSGMFETNLRYDDRYLPFELCGVADSTWTIEIPHENNSFDLHSLSDVVLHISYTAREGGDALRAAAWKNAQARLPDSGTRYLDARQDLADVWHRCFSREEKSSGKHGHDHGGHGRHGQDRHSHHHGCHQNHPHGKHDHHPDKTHDHGDDHRHKRSHSPPKASCAHRFPLSFALSMFPFIPLQRLECKRGKITIIQIDIFIEASGAHKPSSQLCCCDTKACSSTTGHLDLTFQPPGCCDPHVDIPAVVRCEWGQGVYHGVVKLDKLKGAGIDLGAGSVRHSDSMELGELWFPHGVRTKQRESGLARSAGGSEVLILENMYFVVGYVVDGLDEGCEGGKGRSVVMGGAHRGSSSKDSATAAFW